MKPVPPRTSSVLGAAARVPRCLRRERRGQGRRRMHELTAGGGESGGSTGVGHGQACATTAMRPIAAPPSPRG